MDQVKFGVYCIILSIALYSTSFAWSILKCFVSFVSFKLVGIYAGEMMMSVLWYYKPEQMRMKCADIIKCEEVRLMAYW